MKVALLILATSSLALSGCEKDRLDDQVRELCAKDGGVKVYETVILPAENFEANGRLKVFKQSLGEAALGPDYIFKSSILYYKKGNPEMSRQNFQIFRRRDGKLLGESIFYGRGGGDLPGPWHGSSFTCPDPTAVESIELVVFKSEAK
jgi:hypothetical protein